MPVVHHHVDMEVAPVAESDVMRHVVIAQEKTGGRAVVEGGPPCEDEEDVLDQTLGRSEEPQDGVGQVELLEKSILSL